MLAMSVKVRVKPKAGERASGQTVFPVAVGYRERKIAS